MGKVRQIFITGLVAIIFAATFVAACSGDNGAADGEGEASLYTEEENFVGVEAGISTEGGIVIDTSTVTTSAKFYDATIDGLTVEVLAVKATDTTIRLAFNTCQVCNGSKKAYFVQSGYYLVCQNCKSKISINKVGKTSGSCNPVPIASGEFTESDGIITILQSFLEENAYLFTKWKDN